MDSSLTNPKNVISKPSSSSSPPTHHQESSLLSFFENLSPIGSVKGKYSQSCPSNYFSDPSPVFESPKMDLHRQNTSFKSDMKEEIGSEDGVCVAGNVEGENTPHSDSAELINNQRFNQIFRSMSGALDDSDGFLNSSNKEAHEQSVIEDEFNYQQNICRHLQFEDALNHNDTCDEICDNSILVLDSNLRNSESVFHPPVESTESCVSSGLLCPVSFGSKDKQLHERGSQSLSNNFDTVSTRESHFHGEDDQKENVAIVAAGSNTPQSAASMHLQGDSSCVYGLKQPVAPWENAQNSNIDKDLNQFSSEKDRKKAKISSENEGCKRCNCKRSQCLKLYCDCFASGIYCLDTCACENCYNKPEYEDTILDVRQKIVNRNPLAFTPKVVINPSMSPANTMEPSGATPSSARHKRGCNCKRSKCLKKYCECYQAGVGCSDGCRCEDCNNSFGKKTDLMYRSRANSLATPTYVFADLTNMSPIPLQYPQTRIISSSDSRASQVHPNQGSNVHNLTGYLGFNNSPANHHSPKLCDYKGLAELNSISSDSFLFNKWKQNVSPDIINTISTPLSPNQKQQSSSKSPSGLRSRRKFFLRNVSPFPPLTPFSSSKGGGVPKKESSSQ